MNKIIRDSEDYQEKAQRVGSTVAWLDESINHDLIPHLKKALNERDMKQKDTIICAILTYWAGVLDGNRFNRAYPYGVNNFPVSDPNGSRVAYLESAPTDNPTNV